MIKRIKKFIRGGDAATVDRAIESLLSGTGSGASCLALLEAGCKLRFLRSYHEHSGACEYVPGFRDLIGWSNLSDAERTRIRIERLTAFKESLK